jgi:nucleoside-diphosphate-sugar epimerase
VDCNVLATQRLLEAALRCESLSRFVYASSSSVYGDLSVLPLTEEARPAPLSPYGVTKLAGEHLCQLYTQNFGLPTVALRYFTVYGPRQRPDMAFHRFCKAVLDHEPVHVYGDGLQTRDFTYVSDIVEANVQAASSNAAIGQIMNIAGGSHVTMQHVFELLGDIAGVLVSTNMLPRQHGDVRHTFADTAQAERCIGYKPNVSLREGLEREFADMASLYAKIHVSTAQQCIVR